jgi:hypothetical protein
MSLQAAAAPLAAAVAPGQQSLDKCLVLTGTS